MKYDFGNMKGKGKKLYTKMWGGTEFSSDEFITNKNWTGVATDASFYIKTPNVSQFVTGDVKSLIADDLANKFDIACGNRDLFKTKLEQACSGSGQEALKITTMHSSSLCALLFFYNVCKDNVLELELGNGVSKKSYVFNQSFLEFQNVVIKGRQPSNMDVVLVGYEKEDETKPVVLFLESKFSEYYAEPKDKLDIADSYLKNKYGQVIYEKIKQIGYKIDDSITPESKFRLLAPEATYMDGIKQMVSHYIGVRNLLAGEVVKKRACEEHKEVVDAIDRDAKVFLGSIIFDDLFEKVEDKKKYYGAYEEAHRKLVGRLNEVSKGVDNVSGTGRLTVLEEPLTYTKLVEEMKKQGFQLDEKVKKYYFEKSQKTTSDTSEC